MIFRAIFWIGLVSLLMPREPDLGLGRPGLAGGDLTLPSVAAATTGLGQAAQLCTGHAAACAGSLSLLDSFQDKAVRGLAEIKAEIEASRKDREKASPL
jgi:hypothetical protein